MIDGKLVKTLHGNLNESIKAIYHSAVMPVVWSM